MYFGVEHGVTSDALEGNILKAIDNVLEYFEIKLDTPGTVVVEKWSSLTELVQFRTILETSVNNIDECRGDIDE